MRLNPQRVATVALSALLAVLPVPTEAEEPMSDGPCLYAERFEDHPLASGWSLARAHVRQSVFSTDVLSDTAPHSGRYALDLQNTKATSGAIPVEPMQFYRLSFVSRSTGPRFAAYWCVRFFDENGTEHPANTHSAIYPSETWRTNTFYFMTRPRSVTARLAFQPVASPVQIDDVALYRASREEVLGSCDTLYASLPPLRSELSDAAPPRFLENSLERLRRGEQLRIVVLGDSIANDLLNSHFQLLIERQYPGSRVVCIPGIRSGSCCPFYRREDRVQTYVVDARPDLVIIAGISHGNSAQAVTDVIEQVRRKMEPAPEFLVCTGAVHEPGAGDWFNKHGSTKPPAWARRRAARQLQFYRDDLEIAAPRYRFALLDMRTLWDRYVATSGQPLEWFQRDHIHANERGKQVLGRIMEQYFAPRVGDQPDRTRSSKEGEPNDR